MNQTEWDSLSADVRDRDTALFEQFTENTGSHMLDSGGAYGRHWERNQGKTLLDFINAPNATASVDTWTRDGETQWSLSVTQDSFHFLRDQTGYDDLCREYNSLPCEDWDSEEAYGVSAAQESFLRDHGFVFGATVNTYNETDWYPLSQVLQVTFLHLEDDDDEIYVLVQVHGGCDVRGGYTDAKLYRLENELCYDGGYLDSGRVTVWYYEDGVERYADVRGPEVEPWHYDGEEMDPQPTFTEDMVLNAEAYYGC